MRLLARTASILTVATVCLAGEPLESPPVVAKPDAFKTLVNPACSHCRDEVKRRSLELKESMSQARSRTSRYSRTR